jgi:hypothetical protein
MVNLIFEVIEELLPAGEYHSIEQSERLQISLAHVGIGKSSLRNKTFWRQCSRSGTGSSSSRAVEGPTAGGVEAFYYGFSGGYC